MSAFEWGLTDPEIDELKEAMAQHELVVGTGVCLCGHDLDSRFVWERNHQLAVAYQLGYERAMKDGESQ